MSEFPGESHSMGRAKGKKKGFFSFLTGSSGDNN